MFIVTIVEKFLIIIIPILLIVATLTLLERKVMASIQIRRGPNVIGFGLLQPLADGLKLLIKEFLLPLRSNKFLFILAPILFLSLAFSSWSVIPFEFHVVSSPNQGVLMFLCFSSLSVYGILLGGWASNSRYAFLGSLRSASQMLSYELVLSLLVLLVCLLGQSLNLSDLAIAQQKIWFLIPLSPFFIMYLIAILAETNRTPFDLPEAEAELVSGYSTEYSSGPFAFYFIAEYCNIIIWAFITACFFLGAWYFPFPIPGFFSYISKSLLVMIFFCWVRAALPRYRWDQLMLLAWRAFLPMVLIGVFTSYSFFEFSNY